MCLPFASTMETMHSKARTVDFSVKFDSLAKLQLFLTHPVHLIFIHGYKKC